MAKPPVDLTTTQQITTPRLRPEPVARIEVDDTAAGRLDKLLGERYPNVGRKRLAELFANGDVRINGRIAKKGDFVSTGDTIDLRVMPVGRSEEAPVADADAAKLISIIVETPDYVGFSKPRGMATQPLRAGEKGTAASAIVHLYPECAGIGDDIRDGGLVRRLDIGTSGVLVAARNPTAFRALRDAISSAEVEREYLAVVKGRLAANDCAVPLTQRGDHVVADYTEGQSAYTEFTVERTAGDFSLVRAIARSGRMHQVRAHLAMCGAAIVGDTRYGGEPISDFDGFFLHAEVIGFAFGGKPVRIVAPLDNVGQQLLRRLHLS